MWTSKQNPTNCWSIFNLKQMKHDAIDDDERDDADDSIDGYMRITVFDDACCDNVLKTLDVMLPKPRLRASAD